MRKLNDVFLKYTKLDQDDMKPNFQFPKRGHTPLHPDAFAITVD